MARLGIGWLGISMQWDDFDVLLIQEFQQVAVGIPVKTRTCR